jgi:hypothetical protein
MLPPSVVFAFPLHYAESGAGTHHEMERFLGTTLGVIRNTTFGWCSANGFSGQCRWNAL